MHTIDNVTPVPGLGPSITFKNLTAPTKLLGKLLEVMGAIDHVDKLGTNEKQGYKYVRASDLYHAIRKEFIAKKIFMTTSLVNDERWDTKTEKGSYILFRKVIFDFTLYDTESGENLTLRGVGDGVDFGGDKATPKAQTAAMKYLARMLFLLPDDSDPEADEEKPKGKRSRVESGEKISDVAIDTRAEIAGSTPAAPSSIPANSPPSKEEMGKITTRLKKLSAKMNDEEKQKLRAFILRTSKREDTKLLTLNEWEQALFELETHQNVLELISQKEEK